MLDNNLDNFITDEDLEINKPIDTVSKDPIIKTNKSLISMLETKKKIDKKMVPVYLEDITLNKLKTVAYSKNLSVANVLETVVTELTKDIEVDEKAVKKYDKLKGNRGKKNNKL